MKFAYVDESGDEGQSDIFVMVGCLVDAYRLRRITADFDAILQELLEKHPAHPDDLKTKAFINGKGGWSAIPADERKDVLRSICELVRADCSVFVSGVSFQQFKHAVQEQPNHASRGSYWHTGAVFVSALIQKKMQATKKNKGLTVLVMDDNKAGMPALSDEIYLANPWFDGLYEIKRKRRGKREWQPRSAEDRFDHIINTAFAIKSNHSSLVQVADALAYVHRRHIELERAEEAYEGEKEFYKQLVAIVEPVREKLGQCPECEVVEFYETIAPEGWKL